MASSKYDNLWQLMLSHNLEVDGLIPDGLICSICKKLMSEPYVATCGCQFCGQCIRSYISNGRLKCPGNKLECNDDLLEIDRTVLQDYRTRMNIIKTVVKCPYSPCCAKMELLRMEQHLLNCEMLPKKCPFELIGCSDKINQSSTTEGHLNLNVVKHSEMLMEVNKSLRRDIDKLKELVEDNVKEISQLKEDERRNKRKIDDLKEKNRQKETILTEEINVAKRCMLDCLDKVKTDKSSSSDVIRLTFERMRQDLEREWNKRELMRMAYNDIESRVKENEDNIHLVKNHLYRTTSFLLSKNVPHNFLWSINDFSRLKGWHQSETFVNDDYKLCLSICIGSDTVYLYLQSIKGDKDDHLPWPMAHTVTLTIVNQSTMTQHKSDTFKYDAKVSNNQGKNYPRTNRNTSFGKIINTRPSTSIFDITRKNYTSEAVPLFGVPVTTNLSQAPKSTANTSSFSFFGSPPVRPITRLTDTNASVIDNHSGGSSSSSVNEQVNVFDFGQPQIVPNFIPSGESNIFSGFGATTVGTHDIRNHTNYTGSVFPAPVSGMNFLSPRNDFHTTPTLPKSNLLAKDQSPYNMWCLWISMDDINTIPGLLVNDCLMVSCYLVM